MFVGGGRTLDDRPAPPVEILAGRIVGEGERGLCVDAGGLRIAPGFIDLQVNGAFGRDFTSDPSSIWDVAARLPRFGVTAFLPTVISSTADIVRHAREILRAGPPDGWQGATPIGIHCEGPMISAGRPGAHPPSRIQDASVRVVGGWGGCEHISMVTVAPELPGSRGVIEHLVSEGVVVSLGHSDADFECAMSALDAGATCGTHLFNAMSGLDHRKPGLAAALLTHGSAVSGVIVDGIHVDPRMISIAAELLGPQRLALVTDCIAAAGRGDGVYRLGDETITVTGWVARTEGGVLAGSVLSMDQAVRNLIDFTGWSADKAVASATSTPAGLLDDHTRGCLAPGCRGDLVLLDDELKVRATIVGGEIVFDDR